MPTRVLLEGPAIEPLLAQVRQQYGPTARIISADKVRRGGLGGFFAREHYELSVEVDDLAAEPATPASPASKPKAGGDTDPLLALVEARQDQAPAATGRRPTPKAEEPQASVAPPTGFTPTLTGTPGSGAPAATLGPQTPADEPDPAAAGTPLRAGLVSTAHPGFAEVLAGLSGGLRKPESSESTTAGAAATPAGTLAARTTPAGTTPAGAAATPEGGVSMPPGTDTPPDRSPVGAPAGVNVGPMYGPGAGSRRRTNAPAAERRAATAQGGPAADLSDPAVAEYGAAPATGDLAETDGAGTRGADLARLGVPAALAAQATDSDPYRAALQALATLPPAPPLPAQAGDMLVLVGELAPALQVAEQVIEQLRLNRNALYVVADSLAGTGLHGSRRLVDPADAARKAVTLRGVDHPHVVVVDVPLTGRPAGWVDEVCTALDASDVWAVVDATRKTTDTAAHLKRMGEVDALAVYDLNATGDPASALALPYPVALLDGTPATGHAWAALLATRLGATPLPSRRRRRRSPRQEQS